MEKETIRLLRIKGNEIFEKDDEVAIEYQLTIPFRNRDSLNVTCTPAYLEEMILGRRFLEDDFSEEEYQQYVKSTEMVLETVRMEDIFQIAKSTFENPGTLFTDTGCAHGCALVKNGKVLCFIEDIGRHNALDKVIGYALKHRIPMKECFVFSSGRISEDYLEKAIKAGFPMVVSRAAVTGAAVALAREKQITMLGFIRKYTGNLYSTGTVKLE